jgi:hypothetical protein
MEHGTQYKKVAISRPQPGCHLPNSHDIPAGDGKVDNFFTVYMYRRRAYEINCS